MALSKNQQNIIGGTGLGIVLLIFLIVKVYIPAGKEIDKLETEFEKTKQQIQAMKITAQQRDKLQMEMELLRLEVQETQKQLPKESEMDDLLRLITDAAQKADVYIKNFDPSPVVPKDIYSEIPIKLQVLSTYHNVANFITELSQSERIIAAGDLVLGVSTQDDYTVSAGFNLTTYMSK